MTINQRRVALSRHFADLDEDAVLDLVRRLLVLGEDPFRIVDKCQLGMVRVGQLYENGTYFISGLIMAGEIMEQVSRLVLPGLQRRIKESSFGRILVGTVQGDIHSVGKNMFKVLVQCFGFTVRDIGEDVDPAEFVKHMKEFSPQVIGLSCLLTTAYDSMRETVAVIRSGMEQVETPPRIIIGGAVDPAVCQYVRADHWTNDAMEGVRFCRQVTERAAAH